MPYDANLHVTQVHLSLCPLFGLVALAPWSCLFMSFPTFGQKPSDRFVLYHYRPLEIGGAIQRCSTMRLAVASRKSTPSGSSRHTSSRPCCPGQSTFSRERIGLAPTNPMASSAFCNQFMVSCAMASRGGVAIQIQRKWTVRTASCIVGQGPRP